MGNYILYHQNLQGWGSKIIKQLAKAIRLNYPEKKGYSERNLTSMCQFARSYPLNVLRSFIDTDARLSVPSIQKVADEGLKLNNGQFTQELTAQIQSADCQSLENQIHILSSYGYDVRTMLLSCPCLCRAVGCHCRHIRFAGFPVESHYRQRFPANSRKDCTISLSIGFCLLVCGS